MQRANKEMWLDSVFEVAGDMAGDLEKVQFRSMTRAQLVAVEFVLVAMRDNACQVGCGDCDWCDHKNKEAQAAYAKSNPPPIGKPVTVLPMTIASRAWIAKNKANRSILLKWEAERLTVRAPNGKQRTFGPREATWSKAVV
jgi:hypothetical protein